MKKKRDDQDINRVKNALEQVFGFTDADTAANRDGEISEAQKARMERKHQEDTRMMWIGLVSFGVIGLFGSTAAAVNEGIPVIEMWGALAITIGSIAVVLWLILMYNRRQMYRTIREGTMHKVRGSIHLMREGHKPTSYYFCVGSQRFSIVQSEHFQLSQAEVANHEVVVYYTKRWRTILSVDLAS